MYSKNRFYSLLQELFGLFLTRQRFTEIPVLTAWVRSYHPKATELPGRSGSVLSECKIKQVSVSKIKQAPSWDQLCSRSSPYCSEAQRHWRATLIFYLPPEGKAIKGSREFAILHGLGHHIKDYENTYFLTQPETEVNQCYFNE